MNEPSHFAEYSNQDKKWDGLKLVGMAALALALALTGIFTAATLVPLHL